LKFLVDMPVTPRAVSDLQAAGHDAVHASTIGLSGAADLQVIAVARREGRVVVTADLDYPRLLALEHAEGPGIVLFREGSYSDREMLGLLRRVLELSSPLDLERSITVVDHTRLRRRRLPVRPDQSR
jgi:predicted nuclease of predicted toxin-antitoxin system